MGFFFALLLSLSLVNIFHKLTTQPSIQFSLLQASSSTLPPSLLPSPFSLHLAHLSLLNLSLPFQALHKKLDPLTTTFPLLLFNAKQVISILTEVLSDPDEPEAGGHGAIPAVLELLPPLAQSLLDAFLPHLNEILPPLLSLTNSPFHLPLLFPSISGLLKPLSPLLLLPTNKDSLVETWNLWKTFLVMVSKGGQSAGEEQRRLAVEGWGSVVRRGGRGEGGERLIRIMIEDLVVEEEEGSVGLKDGVCLVLVEGMKVSLYFSFTSAQSSLYSSCSPYPTGPKLNPSLSNSSPPRPHPLLAPPSTYRLNPPHLRSPQHPHSSHSPRSLQASRVRARLGGAREVGEEGTRGRSPRVEREGRCCSLEVGKEFEVGRCRRCC